MQKSPRKSSHRVLLFSGGTGFLLGHSYHDNLKRTPEKTTIVDMMQYDKIAATPVHEQTEYMYY